MVPLVLECLERHALAWVELALVMQWNTLFAEQNCVR